MSAAMSSGGVCPGCSEDSWSMMSVGAEMLCTRALNLLQGAVWSGIYTWTCFSALLALLRLVMRSSG